MGSSYALGEFVMFRLFTASEEYSATVVPYIVNIFLDGSYFVVGILLISLE